MTGTGMGGTAPRRIAVARLSTGSIERLSTELVSVKRVEAGLAVSYGGEHVTAAATTLALVPLGYADGIPRSASGATVTVGGVRHAIRGRVAMDQLVLDLGADAAEAGGAPVGHEPRAGDEVVIWGDGGATIDEWAAATGVDAAGHAAYLGARTQLELVHEVHDADAMERLGAALAPLLVAGDAVILTGELGAGKTTLTRGLGAALGAQGTVSSPTFVIARTHETAGAPLLHVDAYRLGGEAELGDLDLDLDASITVAEWGMPLTSELDSWLRIDISRAGGVDVDPLDVDAPDPRTVSLAGVGPAWPQARIRSLVGIAQESA